jgi:hypothetical protein
MLHYRTREHCNINVRVCFKPDTLFSNLFPLVSPVHTGQRANGNDHTRYARSLRNRRTGGVSENSSTRKPTWRIIKIEGSQGQR